MGAIFQGDTLVGVPGLVGINRPVKDCPVGTIITYMGKTAPDHYLACDGSVYPISAYQTLADFIYNQFGDYQYFGGDSTASTFAVPDLRGEFLRGTGTNSHADQGSGEEVGIHQDGTIIIDAHSSPVDTTISISTVPSGVSVNHDFVYSDINRVLGKPTGVALTSNGAAFTARPTNTSILYCIKYEDIDVALNGIKYSTDEVLTGDVWIDGKPIYRKFVTYQFPKVTTNGGNPQEKVSSILIPDLDTIVRCSPDFTFKSWSYNASSYTWKYAFINTYVSSNGSIYAITNAIGMSEKEITSWIEYTKIT